MELKLKDLPMYKEGYKNIAIQIKELDIIDNEAEIERLEGVIKENQAKIESWKVQENDQKEFEEHARPYNAKISEAQTKIVGLEKGIEENKKQQEENKKQQKQMKVHMDNARKNAENYYNETRKNLEQEWENSEEKKQYDSKKEMLEMLNSKNDRTVAEAGAIIRLTREIRDIKQAHLNNIKNIDEEYKMFLQDLDTIDNEYGINKLEELEQTTGTPAPEIPVPGTPESRTPAPGTPAPETLAPETSAPGTPESRTPASGTPASRIPASGTPESRTPASGTPTSRTPASGTPTSRTPASGTPALGTLKSFKIEVTKDGSRFVIMRDGEEAPQSGDWHKSYDDGEHLENIAFETENKEMLDALTKVGDKFIINEIILAVTTKEITYEEGRKQLNSYLSTLIGKETKNSQFQLTYDLRGLARSGMDKEQRKYIIKKAKEARKFQEKANVTVKTGFFRGLLWKVEDKIKLWNKNKALPEGSNESKMTQDEMDKKKELLRARLKDTGRVTENQMDQGLNAALKQQDNIKKEIDEGR